MKTFKRPAGGRGIMRRGKILYSLIGLMMLAGLLPLLVTSSQLMRRNREALETSEKLLQLDQTRSIAQQAQLYIQSMHNQVEAIAQTFQIGGSPQSVAARIKSVSQGESLINYIQEGRNILSITVSDRDGIGGQVGYRLDDERLESLLSQSFNEALSGESWVSPPHVSKLLLDTVVVISAPIRDGRSGRIQGVVSAMISLAPIQEIVKDKQSAGRDVYIVDEEGGLVTHSSGETLFEGVDVSNTAIVRAFQESRGQLSGSVNFELTKDGETRKLLGTYTPVRDANSPLAFIRELGWGAVVQAEESAVYHSARELELFSYTIAIVAGAIAVVLAIVFSGRLSKPVAQLAESARRLASGDFSQTIRVRSGNEIGEFADTFNYMIAEIRTFIERLRQAAEENKQMFTGAVTSLAAAIDAKDPYTAGHSERVAHYSATIARVLGHTEEQVETVRLSALMHDVGKIGIEDRILGKAGPLTDEEFEIMKTHPTMGAIIMEPVPQLKDMIPGLKYHHENVDGSGYPEGLKGDQIPLTAKIVSVADTFDAMTTNRPYQKAMEITYVFSRMRSFIGKKFEKHIVEALITAYEEGLVRPDMEVKSIFKPPSSVKPRAASPQPPASEPPAPALLPSAPPSLSPPASQAGPSADGPSDVGPPPALIDRAG